MQSVQTFQQLQYDRPLKNQFTIQDCKNSLNKDYCRDWLLCLGYKQNNNKYNSYSPLSFQQFLEFCQQANIPLFHQINQLSVKNSLSPGCYFQTTIINTTNYSPFEAISIIPCFITKEYFDQVGISESDIDIAILLFIPFCLNDKLQQKVSKLYIKCKAYFFASCLTSFLSSTIDKCKVYCSESFKNYKEILYSLKEKESIIESLTWLTICREKTKQKEWTLESNSAPDKNLLYNITNSDEFSSIREQLMWKWKHPSCLYYVGNKTVEKCIENGILTYEDPRFIEFVQSMFSPKSISIEKQIQRLMYSNLCKEVIEIDIETYRTDCYKDMVYLDIETTTTEKVNVHIIGCFYKWFNNYKYKSFCSKDSSCIEECKIWLQQYHKYSTIVHFTDADKIAIPNEFKTLDCYKLYKQLFIDINNHHIHELYCNNFKLKRIYDKVCKRIGCNNKYIDCKIKNGLEAMNVLDKYRESDSESYNLEDVILYNQIDCEALFLVHQYALQCYDQDYFDQYGSNKKRRV